MTTNTTPGRNRFVLVGAFCVALISTAAAYVAMVGFGRDILQMNAGNAYAFAGVFELSLVTVALMAREAAQQDRPAQTLLTLTWLLSAASGTFAAMHELYEGHGPVGAVFRFTVPLLAALMWHLALIGDRHLAMERSWAEMRTGARLNAMMHARVERQRAAEAARNNPSRRALRRLARANARWEKAEAVALRTVPPAQMRHHTVVMMDAFEAVRDTRPPADRFALEQPRDDAVTPDVTTGVTARPAMSEISAMSDTSARARVTPSVTGDTGSDPKGDTVTPVTSRVEGDSTRGDREGDSRPAVTPNAVTPAGQVAGSDNGLVTPAQRSGGLMATSADTLATSQATFEALDADTASSRLQEAQSAEKVAADLAKAMNSFQSWTKELPERLSGADWSTAKINEAVHTIAAGASALGDPTLLQSGTTRLRLATEGALGVGEVAAEVGAHGRVERFGGDTGSAVTPASPSNVTPLRVTPSADVTPGDTGRATGRRGDSAGGDTRRSVPTAVSRGVATARVTPASSAGAPAGDSLAKRVAELAEKTVDGRRLTRQQIADQLGVSKRTVQRYLKEN